MTMNDEEIKKALECCGDETGLHWCVDCPYYDKENDLCQEDLNRDSLALINRQQERIEELEIITGLANKRKYYRKFVDEVFGKQKGKELSEPDFDYIYQLYFEQQAEIERLQSLCTSKDVIIKGQEAEIERLKAEIDDLKHEIRNLECEKGQLEGTIDFLVAEAKSEAIKEFAERLKERVDRDWDNSVDADDIDKLVAEMVGGENA